MTARRIRLARSIGAVAVSALAALTLTGCLSVNADLTIAEDAQASGTFAVALQKQAAGMLGITSLEQFSTGIKEPDMSAGSGDLLSTGDCAASETATDFVYTCSFSSQAFTAETDPWQITRSGDTITFHFVSTSAANAAAANGSSTSDLLNGGSLGTLTVNVTFPGEITGITGPATKTSDTSATITGAATDPIEVTITSAASSSGISPWVIALITGLAILAIVVVAVVVILLARGGRRKESVTSTDGTPPAETSAP